MGVRTCPDCEGNGYVDATTISIYAPDTRSEVGGGPNGKEVIETESGTVICPTCKGIGWVVDGDGEQ